MKLKPEGAWKNSDGSINATSVQLRPTPINGNVPSAQ